MKTATLEPETITTSKTKSKVKPVGTFTLASNVEDYASLIDDQSVIYSSSATNSVLRSDFGEWKTVKSKGSKNMKKSFSESSDGGSECGQKPQEMASGLVPVPMAVSTKAKSAVSTIAKPSSSLPPNTVTNECGQPITTDPVKRLRNLRKKMKEIESLKQKDVSILEKEQIEKINREEEILEQIEQLAKLVEEL